MDITGFQKKIENQPYGRSAYYIRQYNGFWSWKTRIERGGNSILNGAHVNDTCDQLLSILPKWQTYRGIKCYYETKLPTAIRSISDAYNAIRRYSLLEFSRVPDEALRSIWESLGLIKEEPTIKRPDLDYFVIAVCKPLMFIWGQTLAFDSINRVNIGKDRSLEAINAPRKSSRWSYSQWKTIMQGFQTELLKKPELIDYCQSHSRRVFGTDALVPYGRYLDLLYYY